MPPVPFPGTASRSFPIAFASRLSMLVASTWFALAAAAQAPAPTVPPLPSTTTTATPNSGATSPTAPAPHDATLAVLWMQRAAEYRASCLQAYRAATTLLPNLVEDPSCTACLEQGERTRYETLPPAVVLDVDETVLDNSAFMARSVLDGRTKFDPQLWSAWVHEQQASAIPGALAYAQAATQLGVRVVYVTNRKADSQKEGAVSTEESDTRANLKKLGFPIVESSGEDVVLCSGEVGDKAARRTKVCEQFRVVQLVGDNLGDFAPGTEPRKPEQTPHGPAVECAQVERDRARLVEAFASWWGQRWILIPNPSYGGFETVVRGQFESLDAALQPQRPTKQ